MISIPHDATGAANQCPACAADLKLHLTAPLGDVSCPHCGHSLWYVSLRSSTRFFRPDDANTVQERLTDIVAQQLGVDRSRVRADWTTLSELGADSLEVIEILIQLEEQFDEAAQR
jgi:acyl carrier protein